MLCAGCAPANEIKLFCLVLSLLSALKKFWLLLMPPSINLYLSQCVFAFYWQTKFYVFACAMRSGGKLILKVSEGRKILTADFSHT
jgi:hypothetical protein